MGETARMFRGGGWSRMATSEETSATLQVIATFPHSAV